MMNLLTSEMSGKHIEKQLINVWRLACAFSNTWSCGYTYPPRVTLSGTPLNEAIISLHQIIPHFQKTHKLQKVHCIVLTDGEANTVPYHVEIQRGPLMQNLTWDVVESTLRELSFVIVNLARLTSLVIGTMSLPMFF